MSILGLAYGGYFLASDSVLPLIAPPIDSSIAAPQRLNVAASGDEADLVSITHDTDLAALTRQAVAPENAQQLNIPTGPGSGSSPAEKEFQTFEEMMQATYAGLSTDDLRKKLAELNERIALMHHEEVQAAIREGRAEIVDEDDFSFPANNDPGIMHGGHFDGETYYKAQLLRFDAPELFALRDEQSWVAATVNERGGVAVGTLRE